MLFIKSVIRYSYYIHLGCPQFFLPITFIVIPNSDHDEYVQQLFHQFQATSIIKQVELCPRKDQSFTDWNSRLSKNVNVSLTQWQAKFWTSWLTSNNIPKRLATVIRITCSIKIKKTALSESKALWLNSWLQEMLQLWYEDSKILWYRAILESSEMTVSEGNT